MKLILLLSIVLVAEAKTTADSATAFEDSNDSVERDGRILIQDNYYSIMSKLEQQEKEIAALKTQDSTLKAEVASLNTLKAEVATLKAQQAVTPQRVAFKAHLTTSMNPAPNQLIVFNDIRFNFGNAYRHGTFIAPYSGTYLFSITMCSHAGHYIFVDLLRNGTVIGTVLAGDTAFDDCASETTVTELTSGDDVIVQHQNSRGDSIFADSGLHSSFTGVLLY